MKITEIKLNQNNPRVIKDDKFAKLKKSIQDFPQMLELRPLVIDENNTVLGGNMRLRALQDLGIKEVPVVYAKDLTEEQKKEFTIKDNLSYGEWDWSILANEWDNVKLEEWGLNVWTSSEINLDDFFKEDTEQKEIKNKIILEYTETDYNKIIEAFKKYEGTKEDIIYKLLLA